MKMEKLYKKLSKLLENVPKLRETDGKHNPTVHFHFFNIMGRGDWYATEAELQGEDLIMFGYVKSPLGEDCDEYGYFTLNQLIEVNKNFGFEVIEVDAYFKPCKLNEVR